MNPSVGTGCPLWFMIVSKFVLFQKSLMLPVPPPPNVNVSSNPRS